MLRRIVIHAGFHKTGTSTIQDTLRHNRVALKGHAALRLRWHMRELVSATRGYSTWRDDLSLAKVEVRFAQLLTDLPRRLPPRLILSAEELSGHLPGRGNLADYSTASALLHSYFQIIQERFPEAEILFYLSTRAPEPWLRSAYWEHVKASNMTMSFDAFQARYSAAADLDGMVAQISDALPTPVYHQRLEDCVDLPLGPADPLISLCDLPDEVRRALAPVRPSNAHLGEAVLQKLLEANMKHPDADARNAAKALILKEARQT